MGLLHYILFSRLTQPYNIYKNSNAFAHDYRTVHIFSFFLLHEFSSVVLAWYCKTYIIYVVCTYARTQTIFQSVQMQNDDEENLRKSHIAEREEKIAMRNSFTVCVYMWTSTTYISMPDWTFNFVRQRANLFIWNHGFGVIISKRFLVWLANRYH